MRISKAHTEKREEEAETRGREGRKKGKKKDENLGKVRGKKER